MIKYKLTIYTKYGDEEIVIGECESDKPEAVLQFMKKANPREKLNMRLVQTYTTYYPGEAKMMLEASIAVKRKKKASSKPVRKPKNVS